MQKDKTFKTIIFDSVQTMQQMAIQSLFISGFSNHQMDFGSLSFKDLHVGDWGKLNRWTITLITRLNMMCKNNGKNLIYIANVKEEYDTSEDRDKVKDLTLGKNQIPVGKSTVVTDKKDDDDFYQNVLVPNMSPQACNTLVGTCDCVAFAFIRKVKTGAGLKSKTSLQYCLRIGPSPRHVTRVRKPKSTKVDSVLYDPSWKELLQIIKCPSKPVKKIRRRRLVKKEV